MNSNALVPLQQVSLIKQEILTFAAKWKDFYATEPIIESCPSDYVDGIIKLDVIQCCTTLPANVPPQKYDVYPADRMITEYAEYLSKLTQGKYKPAPLLTSMTLDTTA